MLRTQLLSLLMTAILGKNFPNVTGSIIVPVGNHGSASVEVVDGNLLKTTDSQGSLSEELLLDLNTGVIVRTNLESKESTRYLPFDQGGAYLPYRQQLRAMTLDLALVERHLYTLGAAVASARQPELKALRTQLESLLVALDRKAPDSIAFDPLPRDMRQGMTYTVGLEYLAQDEREILFGLDGQRVSIKAGFQKLKLSFKVPENAALDQPSSLRAAIVPVGGNWTDSRANDRQTVTFKKTRMIVGTSATYLAESNPRVAVYSNYFCPGSCDVRVDIYNEAGEWLTSAVTPADAPYVPNDEQFTAVYVNAPSDLLAKGQEYSYFVKILPKGGTWEQAYDQMKGSFRAGL